MSTLSLLIFCTFLCLENSQGIPQNERPHIVVILADDLGWDDVSLHGSKQIPTPNIDALAADGILLNNYYVQPICTPSRAALLTGKHPVHLGLQHNTIPAASAYGLGLKEKILPEYLNTIGYDSHMVGKWHLGYFTKAHTPTYRGFKSHVGYLNGCEDYLDHTLAYDFSTLGKDGWGLDFWNNSKIDRTSFGQYSTEVFTTRAEELIRSNKGEPLFLYMPHQAVHSGNPGVNGSKLQAPWKYFSKFDHIQSDERRRLAGMISALDDSVGNVTKALQAKGMLNNTIIVFSTDNGGPADRFDFNCASNWPLRGGKRTMWEGGVRGNGFVWSPLLKQSNYVSNHFMSIMDWMPTLLEAAGYDMSTIPRDVEGMSQWKALSENNASPRRSLLHNIDPIEGDGALRVDDMKVVFGGSNTKEHRGWYPPEMVERSVASSEVHPPQSNRWGNNESIYAHVSLFDTDLWDVFRELGRSPVSKKLQVVVKCGAAPPDVTTNCKSWLKPCLFNVTADPCEYHNLSEDQPEMLSRLLSILKAINSTAVPPYDNSDDPSAYPGKHNGVWEPWRTSYK